MGRLHFKIVLSLLLTLALVPAQGAMVTFSETFDFTVFNGETRGGINPLPQGRKTRRIELPAFDFSLGTLTGVDFALTSDWSGSSRTSSADKAIFNASSAVTARNGGSIRLDRVTDFFNTTTRFLTDGFVDNHNCSAGGSFTDDDVFCEVFNNHGGPANFSSSVNIAGNPLAGLIRTVAAETYKLDLVASTSSVINSCKGDFCASRSLLNWRGSLAVSYRFNPFAPPPPPPVTVMEPSTWLATSLGLLVLGMMHLRRKRIAGNT